MVCTVLRATIKHCYIPPLPDIKVLILVLLLLAKLSFSPTGATFCEVPLEQFANFHGAILSSTTKQACLPSSAISAVFWPALTVELVISSFC